MAKPNEESDSYGRYQALDAKNGTNLHYWISPSTFVKEKKVELPKKSVLHNKTKKYMPLEANSNFYLYKIMRKNSP